MLKNGKLTKLFIPNSLGILKEVLMVTIKILSLISRFEFLIKMEKKSEKNP